MDAPRTDASLERKRLHECFMTGVRALQHAWKLARPTLLAFPSLHIDPEVADATFQLIYHSLVRLLPSFFLFSLFDSYF